MVDASRRFSARIQQCLDESGKTKSELAEYVGVTPQAVARWTAAGFTSPRNVKLIADFFGVSPSWLLYGENPPPELKDESAAYGAPMTLTQREQEMLRLFRTLDTRKQAALLSLLGDDS